MQVMREDYPRDFIDDEYPDMLWDENPDERCGYETRKKDTGGSRLGVDGIGYMVPHLYGRADACVKRVMFR